MTRKILLVEDDEMMAGRLYARLMTEFDDVKVAWAGTLTEADRQVAQTTFDLVISDTCVPGNRPTADAFVCRFKVRNPDTPVLGMSAGLQHAMLMRAAGCQEFYVKSTEDTNFAEFIELVRRLLPA